MRNAGSHSLESPPCAHALHLVPCARVHTPRPAPRVHTPHPAPCAHALRPASRALCPAPRSPGLRPAPRSRRVPTDANKRELEPAAHYPALGVGLGGRLARCDSVAPPLTARGALGTRTRVMSLLQFPRDPKSRLCTFSGFQSDRAAEGADGPAEGHGGDAAVHAGR